MQRLTAILLLASALAACEHSATAPDEREPSASRVGAAATFRVNSTADAVDAQPGNGVCRTKAGVCTLRAAIQEANALSGADAITVPAGTYRLILPEAPDGGIAGGDFNITAPVAITGAGAGRTIIDAGGQFLVFEIQSRAPGRVTLAELTIQKGGNPDGDACAGGLVITSATTLQKVLVTGNCGPAIQNYGSLTVDRSTISGNGTLASGGGIYNGATLLVTRSTISGNWAEDEGGGIANGGTLTVVNSTISGNSSDYCTGGLSNSGTVTLNNATITGNRSYLSAAAGAGGIGPACGGSGSFSVSNTIIAGNSTYDWGSGSWVPSDCWGTLTSAGYNLIGTTQGCTVTGTRTGNKTGNPRLGRLQHNGGPTPTHALLAGSPAINAGNPATPGTQEPRCTPKDQRLLPRGATRCDMGAFEVQ